MTPAAPTVSAVLAVHDGARHLTAQLDSMATQSRQLDRVLVVDDGSTDASAAIVAGYATRLPIEMVRIDVPFGGTTHHRIGANFRHALRLLRAEDDDVVLFADQDDVWEQNRVEHQAARVQAGWALTAASASCIDDAGSALSTTLHAFYPRPTDWHDLSAVEQLRTVLSIPVATGACTAVSGAFVRRMPEVPSGWLHDRWYSLAAAAAGSLDVDPARVIRYRLHAAQTVGASGAGASAARDRMRAWARAPHAALGRVRDVSALRAVAPTAALRRELSVQRVLRAVSDRRRWGVS